MPLNPVLDTEGADLLGFFRAVSERSESLGREDASSSVTSGSSGTSGAAVSSGGKGLEGGIAPDKAFAFKAGVAQPGQRPLPREVLSLGQTLRGEALSGARARDARETWREKK